MIEKIKPYKINLTLLIFIVYLVNFTFCFSNSSSLMKDKPDFKIKRNKFSSFLSSDEENNDIDDLSMFADIDELSDVSPVRNDKIKRKNDNINKNNPIKVTQEDRVKQEIDNVKKTDKINNPNISNKISFKANVTEKKFESENKEKIKPSLEKIDQEKIIKEKIQKEKLETEKLAKQKSKLENKKKKYKLNTNIEDISRIVKNTNSSKSDNTSIIKINDPSKNIILQKDEKLSNIKLPDKILPVTLPVALPIILPAALPVKVVNKEKKSVLTESIKIQINDQKKNQNSDYSEASPFFSALSDSTEESLPKDIKEIKNEKKALKITVEENKHTNEIKRDLINTKEDLKDENKKLFSELDPNFVKNLIKMQKDPKLKTLLTSGSNSLKNTDSSNSNKSNINNLLKFKQNNQIEEPTDYEYQPSFLQPINHKEKVNKNQIKNYFRPEELDMSKLTYINDLNNKVRSDVQKKTMENDQLRVTNKQLDKNYEVLNNQLIISQTKMDSLINEINLYNSIKSSYSSQIEKTKEGNNLINDMNDYFTKINTDILSKEDSIQKYEEKVARDVKTFNEEKLKLDLTSRDKNLNLDDIKKSYSITEKSKFNLIEGIKKNFEDYSHEEIKYLKLKNQEQDLELKVKNEENAEKLIAMEIEHLKLTNMIEIQKIEELKQEIEKSKNMKDYLNKEIDELEEKLKNADGENKQNQIEYELKKNELEDKLKNLKEEVKNESGLNSEEKEKYTQIENDIKNKISYISLQNSNVLGRNSDYILKNNNNQERNINVNVSQPDSNNSDRINNLVSAFYSFKAKEDKSNEQKTNITKNSNEEGEENESKLKNQILKLLKKLNE